MTRRTNWLVAIATTLAAALPLSFSAKTQAAEVLPPRECFSQAANPNPGNGNQDDDMARIPDPDDLTYQRYYNDRFDFAVAYPVSVLAPDEPPTNMDGRTFRSPENDIVMRVYGRNQVLDDSLDTLYQDAIAGEGEFTPNREITYQDRGEDWFVISGYEGEDIFYRKTVVEDEVFKTLELTYDAALKSEMDPIVTRIAESFPE